MNPVNSQDSLVQYDLTSLLVVLISITQSDETDMQQNNTNTLANYIPFKYTGDITNYISYLQIDLQADKTGISNIGLTLANFDRIDSTYSIDEVNIIIGIEGTLSSESGQGTNYDLQTYTWENSSGSKIVSIMFENGYETAKDEVGLN